jgi:hypothetical protein
VTEKLSISICKHHKQTATSLVFRRIPENSAMTPTGRCKSTVETANDLRRMERRKPSRPRVYLLIPLMIMSNCSKSRPSANIVVLCCMNSTIRTHFLSQKQLLSTFWEADIVCLNVLGLFRECVFIHCFDCSSLSAFTKETEISLPVTMYDVIKKFTTIFETSL